MGMVGRGVVLLAYAPRFLTGRSVEQRHGTTRRAVGARLSLGVRGELGWPGVSRHVPISREPVPGPVVACSRACRGCPDALGVGTIS